MSANPAPPNSEGARALARSLFGFALLAWLPLALTWLLLLFSPASPDAAYEQLRRALIVACGLVAAIAFAGLIGSYRLSADNSLRIAGRIASALGNRALCLLLLVALVEINIIGAVLLPDIAPAITIPGRLLLFCWTLLLGGILLTLHWGHVKAAAHRYRGISAAFGLFIAGVVVVANLFVVSNQFVMRSGIQGRLRGALDYRKLAFVDDGSMPSSQQFWAEQGRSRVRWLPYSYWTVEPIAGEFVNVNSAGLRRTARYTQAETAPRIYFFGGSSMWGEGVRDAQTIPSQLAKLLADSDRPIVAENYAQTGYVSRQDLILFQAQLGQGNLPQLAVFYQGFNDVFSAWLQGLVGIPLRESQRVSDVEAGRLLRSGQPVLQLPAANLRQYDWSLVAGSGATAEAIAENWLANRRLIRAAANEFGVSVLFVWQPALFAKSTPTPTEARIQAQLDDELPGFVELYRDVSDFLRDRALTEGWQDLVFLTDLFRDHSGEIFFDRVHINEIGNMIVAQSLLDYLAAALEAA